MTRLNLESAMAAVLTSPSARQSCIAAVDRFGGEHGLTADETAVLGKMASDLGNLTGSFVGKRARPLRFSAALTLSLIRRELGSHIDDELLVEFVDQHPPGEFPRGEALSFLDFLNERISGLLDQSPHAALIGEVAQFERLALGAVMGTLNNAGGRVPAVGAPADDAAVETLSRQDRVRLREGASVARFTWDLRIIKQAQTIPLRLLQRDPCRLCFFHTEEAGLTVLRLGADEADVVEKLRECGATAITDLDITGTGDGKVARRSSGSPELQAAQEIDEVNRSWLKRMLDLGLLEYVLDRPPRKRT